MTEQQLSRLDWLELQWAREKEARQIAERRSRGFEQQAKALRAKMSQMLRHKADAPADRPSPG